MGQEDRLDGFDPVPMPPEPDLTSRRLGDYSLTRLIGRGGMSSVYLAEQDSLRRQVALKVLRSQLAQDEVAVRRFHREAQAAASLIHPNIVQVHEVGCIDGIHFIAQEYVSGQNLKRLMIRRRRLALPLVFRVLQQVAAALQKAGERDIVHRDIKPENILLSHHGEVKVADFGLARTATPQSLELTQHGVTMGTPLYMSPEQIEGKPVDGRSDLYSLGVTAYEMLAGEPPFLGETALAVAVQHLNVEAPPLAPRRRDLPRELDEIVRRLLHKQPEMRFESADALQQALSGVPPVGSLTEAHLNLATTTSEAALTSPTAELQTLMQIETAHLSRRPKWWPFLLAAGLFFGLGAALAWWTRPDPLLKVEPGRLSRIERQENAKAQFELAMNLASERAFLAVVEYFPPGRNPANELYGLKAKLHLAYLYEENDQFEEAADSYAELVDQDQDWQLKVIGLIGQANLLTAQQQHAQANQRLFELIALVKDRHEITPRQRQEWSLRLTPRLRAEFVRQMGEG